MSLIPSANTPGDADPQRPARFKSPSPILQRGKACLSCRRRKMKCDGARPICTPCLRGERAEDCEYTDGGKRPRTLTLEEDVARLQARVWELENPAEVSPSVELHVPYADASPGPSTSTSTAAAQQVQPPSLPSLSPYVHLAPVAGPSSSGSLSVESSHHPSDSVMDVQVDIQHALSTIAPYATELGFYLDLDRLRFQGTQILPALQSVIALWSVRITSASDRDHARTRRRAQALLLQAQTQLASALSTVDSGPDPSVFLHVIQAGVLLAHAMQRIGQVVGARYYASGSWSLAMLLKLHQNPYAQIPGSGMGGEQEGTTYDGPNSLGFSFVGSTQLPPALDVIEAEERVRAFWTVYALDRWLASVGQGHGQSLGDGNVGSGLTVPWPCVGGMQEASVDVIHYLLNDPGHDFTQDDPSTLYAEASVLLGEATEVASFFMSSNAITQSSEFWARFGRLDALLQRSLNAAVTMAMSSAGSHSPSQIVVNGQDALVSVHLLALAHVTLHRPFIATYGPSRQRYVEGAMSVIRVMDLVGESRAGICPIYPIVWTTLCLALHDEVLRLRVGPDPGLHVRDQGEIIAAIHKLVGTLSALSQRCPCKFFASKIEAVLPILESIAN